MVVPFAVYVTCLVIYCVLICLYCNKNITPTLLYLVLAPQTCPGHVSDRDSHGSSQHLTRQPHHLAQQQQQQQQGLVVWMPQEQAALTRVAELRHPRAPEPKPVFAMPPFTSHQPATSRQQPADSPHLTPQNINSRLLRIPPLQSSDSHGIYVKRKHLTC